MKCIFAISLALCLASCATHGPLLTEGPVELVGIASHLPDHAEKANCPGITVHGEEILFKGKFSDVPRAMFGKRIKVTGNLQKGHLPMFVWDSTSNPRNDQGIPMFPGTDLEQVSIYYVIQNPKWEILE
jgi:hypothetical protein